MRALLFLVVSLFLCVDLAHAVSPKTRTLQNAAATDQDGVEESTTGYTTAVIQLSGTFDAIVNFEWSVDGVNFEPIECVSVADRNNRGTTAIAEGGWRCNLIGMNKLRARISNYISGNVTVTAGFASAGVF